MGRSGIDQPGEDVGVVTRAKPAFHGQADTLILVLILVLVEYRHRIPLKVR
jgi:hypothetical protein